MINAQLPHRRLNVLTGEWVLVSPHRTQRPWQGQVEKAAVPEQCAFEPNCYLCPGNTRAGGHKNPDYTSTFVFDNDFAALMPNVEGGRSDEQELLVAEAERGICRVVCFSPNHSLTLSRMTPDQIRPVVDEWTRQYLDLGSRDFIDYVQIFENRGEMMGCSNPHPHGQIWASAALPNEIVKEQRSQSEYKAKHGSCLLCDYAALERKQGERVVLENDSFLVVVPYWAVWPFEVLLLSNRHITGFDQLKGSESDDLARAMQQMGARYDALFSVPFPYTMGFHQRPTDGQDHAEWHFHSHYYPPLLRSATVRKFMVGYEMLATPQRDITPELAAARLRESLISA